MCTNEVKSNKWFPSAIVSNRNGLRIPYLKRGSYWSNILHHIIRCNFAYTCKMKLKCSNHLHYDFLQSLCGINFHLRSYLLYLIMRYNRQRNTEAYSHCKIVMIHLWNAHLTLQLCIKKNMILYMVFYYILWCFLWIPWFAYLDASGDIVGTCQMKRNS